MREFDDILGAGGPFAERLEGFAPRREQLDMAKCVGAALEALEPLVIEAGTGTGKTFAYLVPALLSGRHVIISTGTRTLQDQLYHRDLPAVTQAIGRPVKVALLKGRANYLCHHRLELAAGSLEPGLHAIQDWSLRTQSGDISEVTDVPEGSPLWAAVTSSRENCLGAECPEFARCHVIAARRAAQAADIVIVNHHLLLADLALKDEGFGDLLPGTQAVILDEAHQIPEIAAQFFGMALSSRQIHGLVRDTAAELKRGGLTSSDVIKELSLLENAAGEFRMLLPYGQNRADWRSLGSSAVELLLQLESQLRSFAILLNDLKGDTGIEQCAKRAAELSGRCGELRTVEEDAGVRWVEARQHNWTLQFTPFEVAEKFQQFMKASPCSWIFTSATLAVGEDFSHFTARVGLADARTVRIDSPFDYRRQALIYMPEKMPDPSSPGYTRAVLEAAIPLIEAAGGRAFVLFTSHRALTEGAAWFRDWLSRQPDEPPFPLLVQGDGPREALLKEFRRLGNAVLLGTGSFWEGVDVKGNALSLVIIDKLPFASPDDPILNARLEGIRQRGGNPFVEHQVPQAALALKQGVGRLIRDASDSGVIMLCDPRLRTRGYGRIFLRSLPSMPITTDPDEAAAFLRSSLATVQPRN